MFIKFYLSVTGYIIIIINSVNINNNINTISNNIIYFVFAYNGQDQAVNGSGKK